MVNFPDPQVTSAQVHCGWGLLPILGLASERLNHPALLIVTVLKLWNAVGGLYIWEYFTTLDYEWKVIRRRLPYRWTIWIYSLSRFAALLSIILFFVTLDVTTPINCQLWMLFSILFLCLSSIATSLLIVIRTIAIWNRNKVAVTLAMTVWVVSIGFHLHNIAQVRFKWISLEQACVPTTSDPSNLGFIPTIVADMALLLVIFAGLFVLRHNGGTTFGLARLLWRQGVIWLVLGSAIEIPPLVFTLFHFNVNDPLRDLFEIPSLIVMTVAATRMHRSLIDFASGSTEVTHENRPLSSLVFSKTKRTDTAPTTLDQIKMTVNRAFEQRSTGLKNDGDSATVCSTSEQIPQTTGELDLTPASAHSLPTVSPSPVLEAESV